MCLTEIEKKQIQKILKRKPNDVELKMFAALWNEHCSYKSTKKLLKNLYNKNAIVLSEPNENAGVIDIGDNKALIFKVESHNHPSYIEPYNGAATGVGGILRDIFVMGAKPVALMNALRFGNIKHPKTKNFCKLISKGIAVYSNSFGVPTIGGEVEFDDCYNNNILVNVFAAGIASKDKLISRKTKLKNFNVYYIGASTSNDGVGNSIMASSSFSCKEKEENIQIANPFIGRCCYEAFQELLNYNLIEASTDLGASGLACAITELGDSNNCGIELNLNNVPSTNKNLSAEELLFSETQERILVIIKQNNEDLASQICKKWNIAFSKIATSTIEPFIKIEHNNNVISNIPIKAEVPLKPYNYLIEKTSPPLFKNISINIIENTILKLIELPNFASKEWFYSQFDSYIQSNTIIHPGDNCGVIKLENNTKMLAFKIDSNPSFCSIGPYKGTINSVVKCWRSIISIGAQPLAITNNLNFGSPENPKIMGHIITSIKAMNKACYALNLPIVSGNVSLYNQTNNKAIKPTPTIAAVGISSRQISNRIYQDNSIFLLGDMPRNLCNSILHFVDSDFTAYPPTHNLKKELIYGEFIKKLYKEDLITNCQPIISGGILMTLTRLIIKTKIGIKLKLPLNNLFIKLFSEEDATYIITLPKENEKNLKILATEKKIKIKKLGVLKGTEFKLEKVFNIDINVIIKKFHNGIYNGFKF